MMRIDYIRVPGRKWVENPDHRFDTVEIRAPLITALRRATNAILDDIPRSFSLPSGEIQSTAEPILPTRVIREAIVNAVMHRSYRIHGAIQIIRYANRLEIRNPGHSLKAEEQLGEPGSETRNPKIAAVLHEVNIAETKGTGVRVMRELMQQNNLLPPTLESSRRPDQFVATFLFHHFLGPEDLNWLAGLTRERLSDEEARALVFVREVGAIDNAAYREINRADTLAASTHLRRLRDIELLEKKGSGSRTYYVPGSAFVAADSGAAEQSRQPEAESHQLPPESHHPPRQVATIEMLPPDLAARLPQSGQRPPRDKLRQLIQDLCRHKPMTARELASLLSRRDHKPLVRDHLNPMIDADELGYTIPEMPHHPDQAYTIPPAGGTDDGGDAT
jgi:ATP-dependent DNA helicase RecG